MTTPKMKLVYTISALAIGIFIPGTLAFDIHTHAAMTAKGVDKSTFGTSPSNSPLLIRLGLRDADGIFGNRYIGFGPTLLSRYATTYEGGVIDAVSKIVPGFPGSQTIAGWIVRGAVREDDNTVETPRINETDSDPAPVFNRVLGHFFDPIGNVGLSIGRTGPTAADWALIATATVPDGAIASRENNYKISDAREAMWRALTLKKILPSGTLEQIIPIGGLVSIAADEAERKAYWAATFRTLGDTVHLVQDMAQPQHTRLDKHSGLACPNPILQIDVCVGGHASFFENYLKARTLQSGSFSLDESPNLTPPVPNPLNARLTTRAQLNYAGYSIPSFATYRDFFATATGSGNATGKGLANYSNRGFYSFGTNINGSSFPAPSPTGASLGTETISGDAFVDMTGRKLAGSLKVLTGTVVDYAVPSGTAAAVRLSTEGLWDQFLLQYGSGPRYTLNYYNYDAQADLLIPRAVAYSAGLIDYFFRGQMEITPPDEGVYSLVDHYDFSGANKNPTDAAGGFKGFKTIKLKLRNTTPDIGAAPQIMPGGTLVAVLKFRRNTNYLDDLSTEPAGATALDSYLAGRSTNEEIVVSSRVKDAAGITLGTSVAVNTTAETYYFEFDQELPINATDIYLQVVYRGVLGNETDAVVVQTVNISEPTYLTYMNDTDYVKIGGSVYTLDQITTPDLLDQIKARQCLNTDGTRLIPGACFQPLPLSYPLKWWNPGPGSSGGAQTNAVVALPAPKTYHRFAMLTPVDAPAIIDQSANVDCQPNAAIQVPGRQLQIDLEGNPPTNVTKTVNVWPGPPTTGVRYRGVRGFNYSCVHNGDGSAPGSLDDRATKMSELPAANKKPVQTGGFNFRAPQ